MNSNRSGRTFWRWRKKRGAIQRKQAAPQTALDESKAFLDKYYTSNFSMQFVEGFTVAGTPQQCVEELNAYFAAGIEHIALRMTSWDQTGQLERFLKEVAPAFS